MDAIVYTGIGLPTYAPVSDGTFVVHFILLTNMLSRATVKHIASGETFPIPFLYPTLLEREIKSSRENHLSTGVD